MKEGQRQGGVKLAGQNRLPGPNRNRVFRGFGVCRARPASFTRATVLNPTGGHKRRGGSVFELGPEPNGFGPRAWAGVSFVFGAPARGEAPTRLRGKGSPLFCESNLDGGFWNRRAQRRSFSWSGTTSCASSWSGEGGRIYGLVPFLSTPQLVW